MPYYRYIYVQPFTFECTEYRDRIGLPNTQFDISVQTGPRLVLALFSFRQRGKVHCHLGHSVKEKVILEISVTLVNCCDLMKHGN